MLTDTFGADPIANQTRWERSERNPVIRPEGTGWAEDFIAACSIVEDGGLLRLYAEGSVAGHEQVGLFTARADEPADAVWSPHPANPVVEVGAGLDAGGVFDPSVARFGDSWLMYYSSTEGDAHAFAEQVEHSTDATQPTGESIGMAVSEDGITFTKRPDMRLFNARCPFAVVHDAKVHLFHVRVDGGGYRVHLAVSADGVTFDEDERVLDVGQAGSWDAHSVTTPKVFRDGERWCMSFAGDGAHLDDPTGFGLAFSDDLRRWAKHPGNPVFTVGPSTAFDSASIQSPIIRKVRGRYLLWYAGSDRLIKDGLHSQVGLAWLRDAS